MMVRLTTPRSTLTRLTSTLLSAASSPPQNNNNNNKVRHFVNLSNGAEALPLLEAAGVPAAEIAFCRIQSSHCEAQDFYGVLQNLDHNLLMHLALGYECRIYDFGSRGNFWEKPDGTTEQLWVPRAVWWGLEWSRYALESLWHLESGSADIAAADPGFDEAAAKQHAGVGMLRNNLVRGPRLRGYNVREMFDDKLRAIPKPLWKKLKYYRTHLAPDLREVRLRGFYTGTELDGQRDVYRDYLHAHARRDEGEGGGGPPAPETFDEPLRWYDATTMIRVGGPGGKRERGELRPPRNSDFED